jgi:hypothetical protein
MSLYDVTTEQNFARDLANWVCVSHNEVIFHFVFLIASSCTAMTLFLLLLLLL